MSSPRFVHLRVHSDFSMIDGIAKVKPLVKACVQNEMVAMALTRELTDMSLKSILPTSAAWCVFMAKLCLPALSRLSVRMC